MVGPLFPLGRLVATQGALALIKHAGEDLLPALLERHISGDWGDVSPEDVRENKVSVRYGLRVISSYRVAGERLRVITEVDCGTTTFYSRKSIDPFLSTRTRRALEGPGCDPPSLSSRPPAN